MQVMESAESNLLYFRGNFFSGSRLIVAESVPWRHQLLFEREGLSYLKVAVKEDEMSIIEELDEDECFDKYCQMQLQRIEEKQ